MEKFHKHNSVFPCDPILVSGALVTFMNCGTSTERHCVSRRNSDTRKNNDKGDNAAKVTMRWLVGSTFRHGADLFSSSTGAGLIGLSFPSFSFLVCSQHLPTELKSSGG